MNFLSTLRGLGQRMLNTLKRLWPRLRGETELSFNLDREAAALRDEAAALREAQLLQLIMGLQSQLPAPPRPEPEAPIHFPPLSLFRGETPRDVGIGAEQEEELTNGPTFR